MALTVTQNPLINGCCEDSRDAVSLTAAGKIAVYGELLSLGSSGAGTISRQTLSTAPIDATLPNELMTVPAFLRWAQTTAATAGTPEYVHKIEDVRTLHGRKVMLQGWYRANQPVTVKMRQNFGTGGSPSTTVDTAAQTLPVTTDSSGTALWKPFAVEFYLGSVSGKTLGTGGDHYLAVSIVGPLSTTFQLDLTDLRLHKGSPGRDTGARRRLEEEQDHMDRWYQTYAMYAPVSTQSANGYLFRRPMRAAPSITGTGATHGNITANGASIISSGAAAQVTGIIADARIAA